MLSATVDQGAYDTLPADVQKEYTKGSDGKFALQTDIDVAGMTKQINDGKTALEAETGKLTALQGQFDTFKASNKDKVDVAAVKASGKAEAEQGFATEREQHGKLLDFVKRSTVESKAEAIALAVGGDKNKVALLPHVTKHLSVDTTGEQPKIVVLDKDGKPSAETLDQLTERIRKDPNLSNLVVAVRSSGGSGRQTASPHVDRAAGESLATMSPKKLAERLGKR